MKVVLRKIVSNHTNVRDDEVSGYAMTFPVVGERFEMYAEPRDVAYGIRLISTSPVVEMEGSRFTTRNSTYELVVDEEAR